MKRKVGNQSQSLFNPRIDQNNWRDSDYWFHSIYDSQKDYDSSKTITFIQREIEIERLSFKDQGIIEWLWLILIGKLEIEVFLER